MKADKCEISSSQYNIKRLSFTKHCKKKKHTKQSTGNLRADMTNSCARALFFFLTSKKGGLFTYTALVIFYKRDALAQVSMHVLEKTESN